MYVSYAYGCVITNSVNINFNTEQFDASNLATYT